MKSEQPSFQRRRPGTCTRVHAVRTAVYSWRRARPCR
eukprot:UN1906